MKTTKLPQEPKEALWYYTTPIGKIALTCNQTGITNLFFPQELETKQNLQEYLLAETDLLKTGYGQLQLYFAGTLKKFSLPLAPQGTDFQKRVWQSLQKIPYGETRSYQQIAIQTGSPKACRAVGGANHKNPLPIFIPCHRVIGTNGSMVGFGGGLPLKEFLLQLEKSYF